MKRERVVKDREQERQPGQKKTRNPKIKNETGGFLKTKATLVPRCR